MIRFLQRVLEDLKHGENLDLLIAIAVAIIIAVLGGLSIVTTQIVLSAILATLGLIVIGFLSTRYTLKDIYTKSESSNSVYLLKEKPPLLLRTMIASAGEIWMAGLTLGNTTTDNFFGLRQKAKDGVKIQTLIVDQSKLDMNKVVRRFSRGAKSEHFKADFEETVSQYKDLNRSAKQFGNIQLRFLDFVPSYSLYIFPKTEIGGVVFVELYGYKSSEGSIPRFQLTEYENLEWYKFFVNQFQLMWQDASPATLEEDATV